MTERLVFECAGFQINVFYQSRKHARRTINIKFRARLNEVWPKKKAEKRLGTTRHQSQSTRFAVRRSAFVVYCTLFAKLYSIFAVLWDAPKRSLNAPLIKHKRKRIHFYVSLSLPGTTNTYMQFKWLNIIISLHDRGNYFISNLWHI